MPFCLNRSAAVGVSVLALALTFASGAGATTQNVKIPAEGFPAADLCNGDQIELQGTLHFVMQGEFVEDAPRQHVHGQLNSQKLTGIGVLTGAHYNVNLISNSIENSRVDGANVTTLGVMMNVVSLGSGANSQIQTVLHVTQNANGEITTQFQNFHVHCQSD
jgi:sorbitol-specific phosphotransferase system component IIA